MKIISMILADREIARVEEGVFKQLVEFGSKNIELLPDNLFQTWYDDCFYGIPKSSTFEERFELVEEQNYFCYSKPKLQLAARIL
ncbi:MAG: hypothetical protein HDR04_19385 [Lachnospiraceae bacterium]|nr:hypothetical protein [Lachnospiraceae bacterium]